VRISHPQHVHCIHIHGWNTSAWCRECRNHRANSTELDDRDYEQLADGILARAVMQAMDAGDIEVTSGILADFDFVHLAELTAPSTN